MARDKTPASMYQPVTLRFPKDVLAQCRRLAEQEDRSLNEQVMHILKACFAKKVEPHDRNASRTH